MIGALSPLPGMVSCLSEEAFGQLWSSKTRPSKNSPSVVFLSQKVEPEAQRPLCNKNLHIAEWLTTKTSTAQSATVEGKYRGTIAPKGYFQIFPLRVIPT
jgi:hypothetical protein